MAEQKSKISTAQHEQPILKPDIEYQADSGLAPLSPSGPAPSTIKELSTKSLLNKHTQNKDTRIKIKLLKFCSKISLKDSQESRNLSKKPKKNLTDGKKLKRINLWHGIKDFLEKRVEKPKSPKKNSTTKNHKYKTDTRMFKEIKNFKKTNLRHTVVDGRKASLLRCKDCTVIPSSVSILTLIKDKIPYIEELRIDVNGSEGNEILEEEWEDDQNRDENCNATVSETSNMENI